jgi:predicted ATP-dependent serine protease
VTKTDQIVANVQRFERNRALIERSVRRVRTGRVLVEDFEKQAPGYARWQSGVRKLDDDYGGFYGLTVVGGPTGAGKSMLALGSSLLAAESAMCVVYFDAENPTRVVQDRFARWYGESEASAALERIAGYWHRFPVLPGATLEDLVVKIQSVHALRHRGLLIVVDSLNTLAEFDAKTSADSFDSMRDLLFWLDELVRFTDGDVSSLVVSELNAGGELKGRKSAYIASLVLRMEADDVTPDVVRLAITKSRDGRAGDLGLHLRKWQTGRFVAPEVPR